MARSYTNPKGSGDRSTGDPATGVGVFLQNWNVDETSYSHLLVNGNTATKALLSYQTTTTAEIIFDFGARQFIDELTLIRAGSTVNETWTFEGSNDGATWTAVSSAFAAVATNVIAVTDTTAYRFYRLRQTAGTTSTTASRALNEISFRIEADATDTTTPVIATYLNPLGQGERRAGVVVPFIVTAHVGTLFDAGNGADRTVNGTQVGFSTALRFASSQTTTEFSFEFPSRQRIDEYKVYRSGSTGSGTYIFEGSNDGSTWDTVCDATALTFYSTRGRRLDNENFYKYFRFRQTAGTTSSSSAAAITEVEFSLVADPTDVIVIPEVPLFVTQVPLLVVGLNTAPARFTQVAFLIVTKESEPALFTQVPIILPATPRPVAPPIAVVPEVPVAEQWQYLTALSVTKGGREQRTALRAEPRLNMSFNVLTLDELDRRNVFALLYKHVDRAVSYPLYQYSAIITADMMAGATGLLFDVSRTDIRAGDRIALFDNFREETHYADVATVDAGGAVLATPLAFDVLRGWHVAPALEWRLPSATGLKLSAIVGDADLTLESLTPRSIARPGVASVLTYYDNLPVIEQQPLPDHGETITRNTEWLDNGTSIPVAVNRWRFPFVGTDRAYTFDRFTQLDYWREFADYTKGRQNPFLLPTMRNDLPLSAVPALNATVLVTSALHAHEFIRNRSFGYVRIERANKTVIFRKILSAVINYDGDGFPLSIAVKLNSGIGGAVGDNLINKVSFTYLARVDDDIFNIEHGALSSVISFPARAIIV